MPYSGSHILQVENDLTVYSIILYNFMHYIPDILTMLSHA